MKPARQFLALAALALVACSHTEASAPIPDAPADRVVIAHGDTDAAIANARAVFAELETHKTDYAAAGADLIEGIANEDPQLIGAAVAELARSLPKRISERRADGDR
jgi:hypothetical protein